MLSPHCNATSRLARRLRLEVHLGGCPHTGVLRLSHAPHPYVPVPNEDGQVNPSSKAWFRSTTPRLWS